MIIVTDRVVLRPWREADFEDFVALHADPEVMIDAPTVNTPAESEAKFRRYKDAFQKFGYCRWALERRDGAFLGYVGIMPVPEAHPVAPGVEIGWRLVRYAWGQGYASEGAKAALADGFGRMRFAEVLSYTTPENLRSQAVMRRLGLEREAARDFVTKTPHGAWVGLVWVAHRDVSANEYDNFVSAASDPNRIAKPELGGHSGQSETPVQATCGRPVHSRGTAEGSADAKSPGKKAMVAAAIRTRAHTDPILRSALRLLDAALREKFGYKYVSLILFGSRARGDYRPDSDADVAVVLRGDIGDRWKLKQQMIESTYPILLETGLYIQPWPIRESELEDPEKSSNPNLVRNILRDGIPA